MFIDAVNLIVEEKNHSYLSAEHQRRIYNAFEAFTDESGFSVVKSNEEILENDGSLKITDYLPRNSASTAIPFEEAYCHWEESSKSLKLAINKILAQ